MNLVIFGIKKGHNGITGVSGVKIGRESPVGVAFCQPGRIVFEIFQYLT